MKGLIDHPNIKVVVQNSINVITISNAKTSGINESATEFQYKFMGICAYYITGANTKYVCSKNLSQDLTLSMDNGILEIGAMMSFNNSNSVEELTLPVYSSVVDEGGFSFYDGRMYDDSQKCFDYVDSGQ